MIKSTALNFRQALFPAIIISGLMHCVFFGGFILTFPKTVFEKNNFEITFWGSILDPYDVSKSNSEIKDQLKISTLIQNDASADRVRIFSHQSKPDFGRMVNDKRKTYLKRPVVNRPSVNQTVKPPVADSLKRTPESLIYEHLRLSP